MASNNKTSDVEYITQQQIKFQSPSPKIHSTSEFYNLGL